MGSFFSLLGTVRGHVLHSQPPFLLPMMPVEYDSTIISKF